MKEVIGIISGTCRTDMLKELTKARPMAAIPYGGRYRLIDFALSNMVNTGLRTVGIITPHNYRPILDHLRSGKDWFLDRKSGGLFILPSAEGFEEGDDVPFLVRDLYNNMDYLRKAKEKYVILSSCALVLNMNYKKVLALHAKEDRDITLIYGKGKKDDLSISLDDNGRVVAFNEGSPIALLNIIIIRRELLIDILSEHRDDNEINLFEAIAREIKDLKVYGYPHEGYVARISSVKSYFDHSMDLLRPEVRRELLTGGNKVHTKITDNPPTTYGKDAGVTNSLVGSGCRIEGSVRGSILFREAEIGPGTEIENSIVMQKNIIGRDVVLKNVILDKFVAIEDGTVIIGDEEEPIIIEKGAQIGPREAKAYV